MSIVAWIILGLVAGFIGSKPVNKSGEGLLLDIGLFGVGVDPESNAAATRDVEGSARSFQRTRRFGAPRVAAGGSRSGAFDS